MKLWNNSKREYLLIGVLVGIILVGVAIVFGTTLAVINN